VPPLVTFGHVITGRPARAGPLAIDVAQQDMSPNGPGRFRMQSGRTRQGLPGGRAIPPGPGHWPTAARPPRGFGIELTGKAGKAARQALGATPHGNRQ
jgi:hypothetical protein